MKKQLGRLDAAGHLEALVRRGMKIIPVYGMKNGRCQCGNSKCGSSGKHPKTAHGVKDGSGDLVNVKARILDGITNIGIVTGKTSGIVVLDIDPRNGGAASLKALIEKFGPLPPTLKCETGGGGEHYYFLYPGEGLRSGILGDGIDLKSDGGFVVAPPSMHASGRRYSFPVGWEKIKLATCPSWIIDRNKKRANAPTRNEVDAATFLEGERNKRLMSMAGSMRHAGFGEVEISAALHAANAKRCNPPLPDNEVETISHSAAKYPPEVDQREVASQSSKMVEIGQSHELFVDEADKAYALSSIEGHREYLPLDSKKYRQLLSLALWKREKKVPGAEASTNAVNILTALAQEKGNMHELSNRFAMRDGVVYYDLVDKSWRVVRVDGKGWRILDQPPILFKKFGHQNPQVEPEKGGRIQDILQFVNIKDKDDQLLLLVWLVFAFIPERPHPILFAHGEQGSAKSTFFRMIKKILDPSKTEILTFHSDRAELIQQLSHQAVAFYDNVSRLRREESDALCRAVTGEGFTKRALYTDDEDVILSYRRIVGINGINVAASMPDLLDRSLIFELAPIRGSRWTEEDLWAKFKKAQPRILGGVFDVLSRAMRLHPTIKIRPEFRMADFAVWGCAIAQAMGVSQEKFLGALRRNADRHNEIALESSPLATVILEFMREKQRHAATPTQLHNELGMVRGVSALVSSRAWPQNPSALTRQLNVVKPVLRRLGIEVVNARDKNRLVILERIQIADDADRGDRVDSGRLLAGVVSNVSKPVTPEVEVIDETCDIVVEA